jgi:catechol 2,3-dioxygenase-like lactoylglutathione lyase family enzyme
MILGRETSDGSADRHDRHDWWGVVLEAPDARKLAEFYARLLGWEIVKDEPDFTAILAPDGVAYLAFQTSEDYVRPTWPAVEGRQRMTMHLDFEVSDLPAAVASAVEMGGEEASFQPQPDVRVLLDPAGHPFCLYT